MNRVDLTLDFDSEAGEVIVGNKFEVDLWAWSMDDVHVNISAIQAILLWTPSVAKMKRDKHKNKHNWDYAGFGPDPWRLNDTMGDGDGIDYMWGAVGEPVKIKESGTIIATYVFKAKQAGTFKIELKSSYYRKPMPILYTDVWQYDPPPNTRILREIGPSIEIDIK